MKNNIFSKNYKNIKDKREMQCKLVKDALDVIILIKLLEGPCHGYGMLKYISDRYETYLSPGQLYPALYNLKKEQLVNSVGGSDKKIYFIKSHPEATALVDNFLKHHLDFVNEM